MVGRSREVLENKDKVKVLQAELNSLKMCDLDVLQSNNHEGRLCELDQTFRGWLDVDVAPERNTVESKVPYGHVDLDALVPTGFRNLLGEALEQTIELRTSAALLLFCLELVFIAISVLALTVSRLVELDVSRLAVELDISRLLLVANDDRVLEIDMDNNNKLMLAGLEEQMADVGEENVDPLVRVQRRLVSNTVLVYFDLARNTLALHCWPQEDVVQDSRATV